MYHQELQQKHYNFVLQTHQMVITTFSKAEFSDALSCTCMF